MNDPSIFQSEFSGEFPLSRLDGNLYEYACHEGNHGMVGILAGARAVEQMQSDESGR